MVQRIWRLNSKIYSLQVKIQQSIMVWVHSKAGKNDVSTQAVRYFFSCIECQLLQYYGNILFMGDSGMVFSNMFAVMAAGGMHLQNKTGENE